MFLEFGPAPLHLELDFDTYEGPWQNVHRFRTRSGWLLVAEATIQSQHDMQSERIIVGCDDHEEPIPSFQARHLTEVKWGKPVECMDTPPDILDDLLCEEEGALIVRWHRQRNAMLIETHEKQLARIAVIEGRAKAFISRNDARIADLRRRRRHPYATEDERALLTGAISELEADSDVILAEMAETRASVRRSFEDAEERLWARADLLVEVEPLHFVRWHSPRRPDLSLYAACKTQFSLSGPTNLSSESSLPSAWKLQTALAKARPSQQVITLVAPIVETPVDTIPDVPIPVLVVDEPSPAEPTVSANGQWTPQRIAVLRQLWLEGIPADEIARRLGAVTRNRVVGKAYRIGLPKREVAVPNTPTPSPAPLARPSPMPMPAPSTTSRATPMARSAPVLASQAIIQDQGAPWTPERVELLRRLWLKGLSARMIANLLGGTSRNAVIGKAKRLGLPVTESLPRPVDGSAN